MLLNQPLGAKKTARVEHLGKQRMFWICIPTLPRLQFSTETGVSCL